MSIRYAFADVGAREVTAATMFVNLASRRVMERCGMEHVATLHIPFEDPLPGIEHGEVRYRVARDQWLGRRTPPGVG